MYELLSEVCPVNNFQLKVVALCHFVCMHKFSGLSVGQFCLGTKKNIALGFVVSLGVAFVLQNYGFECMLFYILFFLML